MEKKKVWKTDWITRIVYCKGLKNITVDTHAELICEDAVHLLVNPSSSDVFFFLRWPRGSQSHGHYSQWCAGGSIFKYFEMINGIFTILEHPILPQLACVFFPTCFLLVTYFWLILLSQKAFADARGHCFKYEERRNL